MYLLNLIDQAGVGGQLAMIAKSEATFIGLAKFAIVAFFVVGTWMLFNKITDFDDHHEMIVAQNWSYVTLRVGFVAGQIFAMKSSMDFETTPRWGNLGWLVGAGVVITVSLTVAYVILNAMTGRNIPLPVGPGSEDGPEYTVDNGVGSKDELVDPRNARLGVSLFKASFFVAVGLVVGGAFEGSAPNNVIAFWATAAFMAIGLVLLVAWYFVHEQIAVRLGYSMRVGVRNGQMSSCLEASGVVLALAIIISGVTAGDFTSWLPAIIGLLITAALALVLVYLFWFGFDQLAMRSYKIADLHEQNNVVASFALSALLPLAAIVLTPLASTITAPLGLS